MPTHSAMRYKYIIVFALFYAFGFSQEQPNINSDVPKISPPSPTVAALMKFEEVPVDNYTGIPDISIPLYSIQSHSKDIGVSLALSYHPSSIAAHEIASYVGLGWNLTGSGAISRTIKGYPDELNETHRIGIYRNSGQSVINNYYTVAQDLSEDPQLDASEQLIYNEFVWEANEKGTYDTEQDLYQFNFMGHSGRFIIKKTGTSSFELVRLDNSDDLKITFVMDPATFKVTSFKIYDDKGYQYAFDTLETTTERSESGSTKNGPDSPSNDYTYTSAYQLSYVADVNYISGSNTLLTFVYNADTEVIVEKSADYIQKIRLYMDRVIIMATAFFECDNAVSRFPLPETYSGASREINTKKLKEIQVTDKAKIDFVMEAGRIDDSNMGAYRLKKILVRNWTDTITVKRYELFHSYQTTFDAVGRRMFLTRLKESHQASVDTLTESHRFYYKKSNVSDLSLQLTTDYWGYYNLKPECHNSEGFYRETTPAYTALDVLQKIRLPAGGCQIFNFESNTYSYVGDEEITDFTNNPANYTDAAPDTISFTNANTNSQTIVITPAEGQWSCVSFYTSWDCTNPSYSIGLYNYDISSTTPVVSYAFYPTDGEVQNVSEMTKDVLLPAGTYHLKVSSVILGTCATPLAASVNVVRHVTNPYVKKWLYGGGVRIKNIGYFAANIAQDYYDNLSNITPDKQKNYSYQFFDDGSQSSGSLAFGKPTFEFTQNIMHHDRCEYYGGFTDVVYKLTYNIMSDHNNLAAQRTHGVDVGYKNVTVSETGLGTSKFTYTSPIDVPEDDFQFSYPFIPSTNYDYKRGLIKNQKVFDNAGRLLTQTDYDYTIEQDSVLTGIRVASLFNVGNCPFSHLYTIYGLYLEQRTFCNPIDATAEMLCLTCGEPNDFLHANLLREAFGWVKLTTKTSKEYFYKPDGTQTEVDAVESYTFNPANKRLATYSKETYHFGSTVDTDRSEYTYYTDTSTGVVNRIGDILQVSNLRNGELISKQAITYTSFTGINLPTNIQVAKAGDNVENKVEFTSYDEFRNPMELKQTDGIPISYLWGYNKSQPIAMIENATYAQIATALGIAGSPPTQLATLKTYNESNLTAINGLRAALPGARVTTYTYKPLVGVLTVTDPRGYITTYSYDNFGRLKSVKDADGNLLSENEYKYKTQNP